MTHCTPFRLAALACLVAALLSPPSALGAPDPDKLEQFYENTEVLRRIFYDQHYEPIDSFDDLRGMDPKDVILFFLGADGIDRIPGGVNRRIPHGLNSFVRRGGAVMIATSYGFSSIALSEIKAITGLNVSVGPRILYPKGPLTDQFCYGNKSHCPFLKPADDLKNPFVELFEKGGRRNSFFERVATNEPSFLETTGVWFTSTKALAFLPPGGVDEIPKVDDKGVIQFDDGKRKFALGTTVEENGGRLLLLANHRLFLNRMMLPRDTDNVEFAQNCLSMLGRRDDGETRKRLLFVQYGEVKTKFDIPLQELPDLPENLAEVIVDGLLRLGQRLPRVQEKLAQAEEKDDLHRGLWRMLASKGITGADVMRWGLLTGSALFALYGLFRVGGAGRYRLDPATPLLPRVVARQLPQGPLLERRRREMLDNDNLWEAARDRVRLILLAAGVPEPRAGSGAPTVQVRGGWWRRWQSRRRALRLWRLAFDPTPQLVPKSAWELIDRELSELKAALASGAVRITPTSPSASAVGRPRARAGGLYLAICSRT